MMFDHVDIRVSDFDASTRFYETVLRTLGKEPWQHGGFADWGDFGLTQASDETPVTRRLHIGFAAPSRPHVDAFWRAGVDAGYRDDGAPGPRPQYGPDYYGGFLLDPDGNSAEAVHHGGATDGGLIDHLWIRVADVAASRLFYEIVAAFGGFRFNKLNADPERAQFVAASGSFSVVNDAPTEHVHVAFPAPDDEAVRAFHAAATAAGYRDNGAPGERPEYHAGYYGAFVLDPDGNNVEVVNHNR